MPLDSVAWAANSGSDGDLTKAQVLLLYTGYNKKSLADNLIVALVTSDRSIEYCNLKPNLNKETIHWGEITQPYLHVLLCALSYRKKIVIEI